MTENKKYYRDTRLEIRDNADLKIINFRGYTGEKVEYYISRIFRYGRIGELYEIREVEWTTKALIDINSVKHMIHEGYIINARLSGGDISGTIQRRECDRCPRYKIIQFKNSKSIRRDMESDFKYVLEVHDFDNDDTTKE